MERVSQPVPSHDPDFEFESFEEANDKQEKSKKNKAMVEWNLEAVKEPRGFIKFIEVIIAIFAFATTCSHDTSTAFKINCDEPVTVPESTLSFGYPYKLDQESFVFTNCSGDTYDVSPYGDFSSSSQFYVFVGVMAFLYSLAALVLYVCFDEKYRKYDQIPIADFIITAVFTLLWLISSSAWADGVSKVKKYSDPEEIWINHVEECAVVDGVTPCEVTQSGNFASLNVSIIFGFLNMLVWGGNLWFLYKETKWFKVQSEHPQRAEPPTTDSPHQDIPQSI